MNVVLAFCFVVIFSGWLLGNLLSRAMKDKKTPTPAAMFFSLLAVAIPTIAAFVLSSEAERTQLIAQFTAAAGLNWYLLSAILPFAVAIVGHVAGILTANGVVNRLPKTKQLGMAARMIPMVFIWGLLEEIGWRGFLVVKLSAIVSPLTASLAVGVLWGIWHAPQMFTNPKLKEEFKGQLWVGMTLWVGQCIGLGGVLGWLQLKSGSFLAPTIAHALVNLFGTLSDEILGANKNPKWSGFQGLPTVIVTIGLSLILFWFF